MKTRVLYSVEFKVSITKSVCLKMVLSHDDFFYSILLTPISSVIFIKEIVLVSNQKDKMAVHISIKIKKLNIIQCPMIEGDRGHMISYKIKE